MSGWTAGFQTSIPIVCVSTILAVLAALKSSGNPKVFQVAVSENPPPTRTTHDSLPGIYLAVSRTREISTPGNARTYLLQQSYRPEKLRALHRGRAGIGSEPRTQSSTRQCV